MSVPYTRQLAYVLREQLQTTGVSVLIGTVTAVPDAAHVTVSIQGTVVTIPKLANYVPVIGQPAFILSDPLFTVALGAVSETPPPPSPITDATTLDGIDSSGFLRRQVAGSGERIWWGTTASQVPNGTSGATVHAHPLGRVPQAAVAVNGAATGYTAPRVVGVNSDAANVAISWVTPTDTIPISGVIANIILIG